MLMIRFHIEATSPKSISNVLNKIRNKLEKELELKIINHEKGAFFIEYEISEWENGVYKVIELAQKIGSHWILTGNIKHEINLWSNNSAIVGVKAIEIQCDK